MGEFNLEGIPPAPRGIPQIEVTLDIDANGILNVSAKDKGTGKENKITITANSGLTDEEIERMVKDAQDNEEADKKVAELVKVRNEADGLVHATRKSLTEYGDKLESSEKEAIETAIKDLEEAIKGDNKEEIESKTQALLTSSQKLGEKMYADMQAQQTAEQAGASSGAGTGDAGASSNDDVVDAEFTEVKSEDSESK